MAFRTESHRNGKNDHIDKKTRNCMMHAKKSLKGRRLHSPSWADVVSIEPGACVKMCTSAFLIFLKDICVC
jgi:hypothetical protein